MKKIFIWLAIFLLAAVSLGKSTTTVPTIEGDALHTIQTEWIFAETEQSAQTQTDALAKTERTKLLLDALIAANANEEAQITITRLPSKWNIVRFRGIGVTDNASVVHQVLLGNLGDGFDCELTYAGLLTWTVGTQVSMFKEVAFTSGGTLTPQRGDTVTGLASGNTGIVHSYKLIPASAGWAGGLATGTLTMYAAGGQLSAAEKLTLSRRGRILTNDLLTCAANSATYEIADTCVVTPKAWGSAWSTTSPADDDNIAETQIDTKGADYMVVVTTTCTANGKLMITGY